MKLFIQQWTSLTHNGGLSLTRWWLDNNPLVKLYKQTWVSNMTIQSPENVSLKLCYIFILLGYNQVFCNKNKSYCKPFKSTILFFKTFFPLWDYICCSSFDRLTSLFNFSENLISKKKKQIPFMTLLPYTHLLHISLLSLWCSYLYIFCLGCSHRCRQPWVQHTTLFSVWWLRQAGQAPPLPNPPWDRRAVRLPGHRSRYRTDGSRHPDQSWRSSEWISFVMN